MAMMGMQWRGEDIEEAQSFHLTYTLQTVNVSYTRWLGCIMGFLTQTGVSRRSTHRIVVVLVVPQHQEATGAMETMKMLHRAASRLHVHSLRLR